MGRRTFELLDGLPEEEKDSVKRRLKKRRDKQEISTPYLNK